MILTQTGIDEFVQAYNRYCNTEDVGANEDWSSDDVLSWLTNHPQVVVAAGFQEFVAGGDSKSYKALVEEGELDDLPRPIFKKFEGSWVIPSIVGDLPDEEWGAFKLEDLIRVSNLTKQLEEDAHRLDTTEYDQRKSDIESDSLNAVVYMPSYDDILETATKFVDNPLVDPTVWVSPRLWTPTQQSIEKIHLQNATSTIINQMQSEKIVLADLHWKQLEELVAELLRGLGLEIHLVNENPQGGRDIIARSPMINGIQLGTIAVEVKHREVIDRPIIQTAIQQNNHFPALMLVTSDRFTAGVIREVAKPENRMRISLQDGVAIRDMVKTHKLT